MKKRTLGFFLTCFMMLGIGAVGYAQTEQAVKSDVTVWIDERPVEGYNIRDYTYIKAEDLEHYGFEVEEEEGRIQRNPQKTMDIWKLTDPVPVGTVFSAEQVEGYLDGVPANCWRIDGKLAIQADELQKYGEFFWDNIVESIRITTTDRGLQQNVEFHKIFDLPAMDMVTKGVAVFENGTAAELTEEEIKDLLEIHWNFYMDQDVKPFNFGIPADYFNFYTEDGKKYTLYGSSRVVMGRYGTENYICYIPYIGNAKNALYTMTTRLFQKYRDIAKPAEESPAIPEQDYLRLPKAEWAVPEIQKAAANNVLPYGLSIDYDAPINRLEFCDLVAQMLAQKTEPGVGGHGFYQSNALRGTISQSVKGADPYQWEQLSFSDYESPSLTVMALSELGVISGRADGSFDPKGSITREEAAKILSLTAWLYQDWEEKQSEAYLDQDMISDWAADYVAWCSAQGLMQGTGENNFSPQGLYTREQAITAVNRLYENVREKVIRYE